MSNRAESERAIAELSDKQDRSLDSFAALLRVKLSRQGKIDDFRVELFSRGDSLLSIYVRGFLGKSVLKATIIGDSLTAFFASRNLGYVGLRDDIETGGLAEAGHFIDLMMSVLRGSLEPPDTSSWDYYSESRGSRFDLKLTDFETGSSLDLRYHSDDERFPHLKLETLYLVSHDGQLKIHLETTSVDFNREIPDAKFELELPPGVDLVSPDELGDLLSDIS